MTAASIPRLSPAMVRALTWWTFQGVVHADVHGKTKDALINRGLARWERGDDLCPRLTGLGIQVRAELCARPEPLEG